MCDCVETTSRRVFGIAQEFTDLIRKQVEATGDERLVRFAMTIAKDLYFLSTVTPVAKENFQSDPGAEQVL